MYRDADRQRAAVREAVRRHRAKGITVIPKDNVIPDVIPKVINDGKRVVEEFIAKAIVKQAINQMRPSHLPTCTCWTCRPPK
jgi:hypothetical protein